jgi:hypothetical protein
VSHTEVKSTVIEVAQNPGLTVIGAAASGTLFKSLINYSSDDVDITAEMVDPDGNVLPLAALPTVSAGTAALIPYPTPLPEQGVLRLTLSLIPASGPLVFAREYFLPANAIDG